MKQTSAGFTLIELMITLLLSSVLIAAIGELFLNSHVAFRKQTAMAHLVEDGRYILDVFAREYRRTGFLINEHVVRGPEPSTVIGGTATEIFRADLDTLGSSVNLAAGVFIAGIFNSDGLNDAFDINHVIFRYQLNGQQDLTDALSPCTRDLSLDQNVATDAIAITLYFYVQNNQLDTVTWAPVLYCRAKLDNLTTGYTDTSNAMPLLSNVERMHVTYGVDTDGDGAANQYLTADQVTNWLQIISTRFYIVMRSEETNIASAASGYVIDGQPYDVNNSAEQRMYRVFTTTLTSRQQ